MSKVWFITGASRGMGLEITRSLLEAGHRVVATARRPDVIKDALGATNENLLALALDVTDPAQGEEAAGAAVAKFGRIDVLVNNAGYGQLGWFENLSEEQIQRQFNTNVFGAMHVTRAVLPYMRKQKAGHIFTITSVAGLIAVAGSSIYGASKFAVEGWMEGLHQELAPLGIATTAIEPGFFKTDFLDASSVSYGEHDIAEYAEASARFKAFHDEMNHQQLGDPAKLGQLMMKLAEMKETPVRLAAGSDAAEWAIKKGESIRDEATKWQEYSASTDREGARKADSLPNNV
ncbi:TPA: SDR family NAD(P)-dependent oxidoreductase [Kluyvera ascorbata]|uniref:SDR family NAD(P)-dependent oxidoreductase n=1 Tax=Enterobacteriaceae TaxID=543 RepID=UPI00165E197D|nr:MULTISPECIES: SDR family NAD(P)-dependent oxidoreductase [Enterobacteriaceae]MCB3711909.1 SDR family NAD(P)-dependent oxidoreductase [Klebsiella pneumoniae]MEB8610311.1 SDR family NAD(P)-dependent oxidoreductase [Cronobacter sakazakii]WNU05728.1 SDR family NAD(P)-dependent oxidoreductase [Citrobacter freundii]HAT7516938.1 SDR family NAD(P)-dependent oxidoreductase [Kluyvera ascorbata]